MRNSWKRSSYTNGEHPDRTTLFIIWTWSVQFNNIWKTWKSFAIALFYQIYARGEPTGSPTVWRAGTSDCSHPARVEKDFDTHAVCGGKKKDTCKKKKKKKILRKQAGCIWRVSNSDSHGSKAFICFTQFIHHHLLASDRFGFIIRRRAHEPLCKVFKALSLYNLRTQTLNSEPSCNLFHQCRTELPSFFFSGFSFHTSRNIDGSEYWEISWWSSLRDLCNVQNMQYGLAARMAPSFSHLSPSHCEVTCRKQAGKYFFCLRR